ncbi:unnamed protein product [Chrysoparadoxa australica]
MAERTAAQIQEDELEAELREMEASVGIAPPTAVVPDEAVIAADGGEGGDAAEETGDAADMEGGDVVEVAEETEDVGGEGVEDAMEQDPAEPPYMPPAGPINLQDLDLIPHGGAHQEWHALPGLPEPYEVCITFQAKGAQDFIVGLSKLQRVTAPFYEFRIGDNGNMTAVVRRRQHDTPVATANCMPCAANQWHSYWVLLGQGGVAMGVDETPGKGTLLNFKDPEPLDPMPRYVSFTSLRHEVHYKDLNLRAVPEGDTVVTWPMPFDFLRVDGGDEGFAGSDKAQLDAAVKKFEEECQKQRARSIKFSLDYCPPAIRDFIPWSLAKRLSSHVQLLGGIDTESKEERDRAAKRAERFGLPKPVANDAVDDMSDLISDEKRAARGSRFGTGDTVWQIKLEELSLEPSDVFAEDPDRADPQEDDVVIGEKVHIFSLDKLLCKQMRNNDVKAYFGGGVRYVEWLNDWSFNACFRSSSEAEAALNRVSTPLPSPVPEGVKDGQDIGKLWRLGEMMKKVKGDRHGHQGQWVRVLLRMARTSDILEERPKEALVPKGPLGRGASARVDPEQRWKRQDEGLRGSGRERRGSKRSRDDEGEQAEGGGEQREERVSKQARGGLLPGAALFRRALGTAVVGVAQPSGDGGDDRIGNLVVADDDEVEAEEVEEADKEVSEEVVDQIIE